MRANWLLTLLCLGLAAACVEKRETLTTAERRELEKFISKSATTPQHRLDAVLGDGQVELLGYDLATPSVRPGRAVNITWHWKVNKPLDEGWRIFTHLADADDVSRINQDDNGKLRTHMPPSEWPEGSYVLDQQTIVVPESWTSPKVTVYTGMWKDDKRLAVTRGPKDKDNRVRALTLDVQLKPNPYELHAGYAATPIKLDGKLDDEGWKRSRQTARFVNTVSGGAGAFNARAQTAWDSEHLYVGFVVDDKFLKSRFQKHDDHLWKEDCVEIMIDPDGDGKNYFEMQLSPAGVVFDTRYDARRVPKPFGHVDWSSQLKHGVALRGKVNDNEGDKGWTAELAIPWEAFAVGETPAMRPKPTDHWRMNFYVMNAMPKGQQTVGWSPTMEGDFHVPSKFGTVYFDMGPVLSGLNKVSGGEGKGATSTDKRKAAATPPTKQP